MADGRILSGQAQAFNEQQRRRAMEIKFRELEERLTGLFAGKIRELEQAIKVLQAELTKLAGEPEPVMLTIDSDVTRQATRKR